MDTNKLKAQLAAIQDEINRTAEQYGLGGHLQYMLNGGEIRQIPVAPYGYAKDGVKSTTSIVDAMKDMGDDSSFANRKKMAEAFGIKGYTGTAAQNQELMQKYYASKRETIAPMESRSAQPIPTSGMQTPMANSPVPISSVDQPSFDEVPGNTGAMMMNNSAIGTTMPAPIAGGESIAGEPYSFDELPNTGAMMMNDRATASVMPDPNRTRTLDDIPAQQRQPVQLVQPTKTPMADIDNMTMFDYFRSHGMDPSFEARKQMFSQVMPGYKGTREQNMELMEKIKSGDLDLSKLKKPTPKSTTPTKPTSGGSKGPESNLRNFNPNKDKPLEDKLGPVSTPSAPTPKIGAGPTAPKREFGKRMTEEELRAWEKSTGKQTGAVTPLYPEKYALFGNPFSAVGASSAAGAGNVIVPTAGRLLLPSAQRAAIGTAERLALPGATRLGLPLPRVGGQMTIPFRQNGGMNYFAGGEIENDPHIMELYGFQNGGEIIQLPVMPYGFAEMGMMAGDDVTGKTGKTTPPAGAPKMMNSQQLAGLATQFFSRDPSMQTPIPNFVGSYQLSNMDKTLIGEAMKQMKAGQNPNGIYPPVTPQMIDQLRPRVEQNDYFNERRTQRMGGMNYEDGGQMPMDVAVARFKASGKDKGLSGGELQMYVEKMKSKYKYQKGGVVKEQELGNYEVGMYGSGGIMYNGTKFPGYNKAVNTAPGDKFKKQMLLQKGGKIKLVKFGHR